MKQLYFCMKLLLMSLIALFVGSTPAACDDGPITIAFKNYTEQVDRLTGLDTLELLEKMKDMGETLSAFGVPISGGIAKLLDQGVAKLKPDLQDALVMHHNKTMMRFNLISTQINSLKSGFVKFTTEIEYEDRVRIPILLLVDGFQVCIDPTVYKDSCKSYIKSKCDRHEPFEIIRKIWKGTNDSCKIPTAASFQNYATVLQHFEFFEQNKIDFNSIDFFKKRDYDTAKINFYGSVLTGVYAIADFEDTLIDFKTADKIKFDNILQFFQDYSSGICYLASAYLGSNHSREALLVHGLELANDIVKTRDLLLLCGNFSTVTDTMLVTSIRLINESITNMDQFIRNSLRLSWPTLFQKYSDDILSTTYVPKEKFNETAKNIVERIHQLGPKSYNYVVFLTKFVDLSAKTNIYTSCDSANCLTFESGKVRCIIFRFTNDEELSNYRASSWWRAGAGKVINDTLTKNQKIDSLEELHKLIIENVGEIKYKNFAYFRHSTLFKVDIDVSLGFSSQELDNEKPYKSLYSFYQPSLLQPTINYEEFFLFFLD